MFTLRDNQENTIQALIDYILAEHNQGRNPLVSAPVAFGKSICIAEFCRRIIDMYSHLKILNLVHVKELVDQNYAKFKQICPNISSGLFMDALGEKDHKSQVIYGSVHSVANSSHLFSPNIIMVDECHWIQKKDTGMYRAIIEDIKTRMPNVIVIGWTGTEWRMDGGPLAEGDDDTRLFDDVYYADTIRGMLDKGYHSPLVVPTQSIMTKVDTSGIKVQSNGHQSESEMAKLMDGPPEVIAESVDEYYRLAQGRTKHLVFGTTIAHCKHLKESFSRYYRVEFISGSMKKKDREKAIQAYKDDKLDMLVSGIILTTGFDEPRIDCIGLFRSVSSSALYIQIAGRGLRIHPDKDDCLWLDFTSTTEMHGPVDEVKAPKFKEKGDGKAVMKQCGSCMAFVPPSCRECPECGVEFDMELAPSHDTTASTASIIGEQKPITGELRYFTAHRHTTAKKESAIKLSFTVGLMQYTHLLMFEGKARPLACRMWRKLARPEFKDQCPHSCENALHLINEMGAFDLPREITFTYDSFYQDRNGRRKKLSSPRLKDIFI